MTNVLDSGNYWFGINGQNNIYRWSADLGVIEGLLIEDDQQRCRYFQHLEVQGLTFSSVKELLQYAQAHNWPSSHELESKAEFLFTIDHG